MSAIELLKHIRTTIFTWDHFLIVYVALFMIDTLLLIFVRKHKPSIDKKYFRWHEKHGLIKITLFKIIFICVDMYILYTQPSTGAFTIGIQMYYATIIIFALRDLLKKDVATK